MSPARGIALLALAVVGIAQAVPVFAQAYPTRAIRMVVGFPPGGFTDNLARKRLREQPQTSWHEAWAPRHR